MTSAPGSAGAARLAQLLRERARFPDGARVVFDRFCRASHVTPLKLGWWLIDGVRVEWLGRTEREATARILGLARDGRRR